LELRAEQIQILPVSSQAVPPGGPWQVHYVPQSLDELERRHILQTLQKTHGVKREAARILGINRSTLDRKLERYGIQAAENGVAADG
jgi:Nif-specific regulatory protein